MRYLLFLPFLFMCFNAQAQKGSLSGLIYDTLNNKPVPDATITLLLEKDSSLISFSMTDNGGRFTINNVAPGDYQLLFSHVAYHGSTKKIKVENKTDRLELGRVILHDRTKVLKEVVVRNDIPPVTLIGDTVQYNAGSFKTQPNANVEQLLKRLPGVQVEKDGTVRAQGQKVNRVLVDGKEFFGNDPKMATKNLPADAIDKVQVYDRQSDQAALTGFDDGNSEKTINLKLKKDKKKGGFGKAMAGGGTDGRYEGRFNLNSFKGARQMSAIGMANNTNAEGFSFMDMMNFTGELGRMMRAGNGNININMSSEDAAMSGMGANNNGIRSIAGGGLNYNNLIGTKTELTSNYFYNRYNPLLDSRVQRQYLLGDSSYRYDQHSRTDNVNNTHRLNIGLDFQIDSFHSIKYSPSFGIQRNSTSSLSDYEQRGEDGLLSNKGFNNSFSKGDGYNMRHDLLFRKKFRKRGRTLSLSLQSTMNESDRVTDLESVNQFMQQSPAPFRTDSIDQRVFNESSMLGLTGRLVYTEPILKRSLLEFSLGKSHTRNYSDKQTFDFNKGTADYDQLNQRLSNEFENEYGFSNAGLRVRTQQKKYNYAFGASLQQATLQGEVLMGIKDTLLKKTFLNVLPTARFQYYFSRSKNISLNYSTYTNQPTVTDLQPVPDVSNPLYIREGNPDLKQEFTHAVQINYAGVNPYKNKNLFAFIDLSRTDNKIVSSDSVLTNGIRKTRPVNVDGVYSLRSDISVGLPVRALKGSVRFGSNLGYQQTEQFINGRSNIIRTTTAGPRFSLDMTPHDNFDWSINAGINYNKTRYSIQPSFNTSYFSQVYELDINWQLPHSWNFSTNMVYTINNQLAAGYNDGVPFWTASLAKQFLKFKRGELKLSVNDILNQNVGIQRTSNQSYIEDRRTNSLRRFALLTFTYSLSKTGAQSAPGGIIIRR